MAMLASSDWELLDDGSWNGVRKWMRATDEDEGTVQVRYEGFDVPQIIEENRATQSDHFDKKSEMWHVGHIPTSVMYEWLTKFGVNFWNPHHKDGVKRLLNDPDYRYLRPGFRNIIL
jgi:hypothetical protein